MPTDHLAGIQACVIIPTYNNAKTLGRVLDGVLQYTSRVIVINDGSTDGTRTILSAYPQLNIQHLPKNAGKGKALRTGLAEAARTGYAYAISIDSDGQHFPDDIPAFVKEIQTHGEALLIGARNMDQADVPKKSSFGNRFSNFWFKFETGIRLSDTQSGFRIYPLTKITPIPFYTNKFEFEIEVIVKAAWRGIPVRNIPIRVLYDESERVSHFRPLRDFTRISLLNTWLVVVALVYIKPRNYLRRFKEKGIKRFFFEDLLHSNDSNLKKSLSVALGIFVGISPFWGFQTLIVLSLAFLFKLNKIISFTFSHISMPPMIPLVIYASYCVGAAFLGKPHEEMAMWGTFDFYKSYIREHLTEYVFGSFLLACFSALVFGLVTYALLQFKFSKKSSSIGYY